MCEKAIFLSHFSSTRTNSTESTEQQTPSAHPISGYLLKICEIVQKNRYKKSPCVHLLKRITRRKNPKWAQKAAADANLEWNKGEKL